MRLQRDMPAVLPAPSAPPALVGIMPEAARTSRVTAFIAGLAADRAGLLPLLTVVGLIAVAQAGFLFGSEVGVFCTVLVLALLAGWGVRDARYLPLAIAAAVVPVAGMGSMTLPQSGALSQAVVFSVILAALALAYRPIFAASTPHTRAVLAWEDYILATPAVVGLGLLLAGLAAVAAPQPELFAGWSVPAILLCASVATVAEELFFRGFLQRQAQAVMRPFFAVVLTAAVYALLTVPFGNAALTTVAMLSGALLGAAYSSRSSLVLTGIANGIAKAGFAALMLILY